MNRILFAALPLLLAAPAIAQQSDQTLPADQAIPGLMFFTLIAALAVGIGALLYFLRKRSNRDAIERVIKD